MVGKIIGNRYRVLREIGSGGMAWVYLAEDVNENELVALKVLYPQFGEDLSYVHRFTREAKLASTMTDPHIVRVLDYGADRDIYYLIMEYIEGKDLRQTLEEKGPFPWRTALDILDQLATALEHAHLHSVVHRDIKPQNLMLDETGLLKVLDFGIARVSTLPSLTQSGFIGSPYYVSPEQAMSEKVDIRSDIYSAGIVLFELLSGNIPYDAKSPWSIISKHISDELPPIELADVDASETVFQLLSRMVAKSREDRFQTPTELRRAIAATLAGQPIPFYGGDTRPISGSDKLDMAESLFDRALEAIEVLEWARATDLLNQTLNLNPNHQGAAEKLVRAEQEAILAGNYIAAKRAMEQEAWEESLNNLEAIVEIAPDYKDTGQLLEESKIALEKDKTRQLVASRYAEGVAYFDSGRWEEAIKALGEVQSLSPGYKRTNQLLIEAQRFNNPPFIEKIRRTVSNSAIMQNWGRWGIAAASVAAILVTFFFFNNGNSASVDNKVKEELKSVYEAAQVAIKNNESREAIVLLEQILDQDPDYADAADLRRELIIALTPTPEITPAVVENPLVAELNAAQDAIEFEQWSDAIKALTDTRATDPEFEQARVSSLFCDAYVGRGLAALTTIRSRDESEQQVVSTALADFETGLTECPKRLDLREQADRAAAYLNVFRIPQTQPDKLIQILTPIVAVDPNYVGRNAKLRLYEAYLTRGTARQENLNIVGALGDYEAALALNVEDPAEAQKRRAELLISLQQRGQLVAEVAPTPEPGATSENSNQEDSANDEPTPRPVLLKFDAPTLLGPENDSVFAGKFADVLLEWDPPGELAEGEYYDLTIMHFFADEPQYFGFATRETGVQIVPQDIGVGRAGNDRFYWWVTIRQADSAPYASALDLPLSPQSEAKTFIWVP